MTDFGRFSDSRIEIWIDQIQALADAGSLFAGLCHSNPLVGDPAAAEIIGDDYIRLELGVEREAYNLLSNADALLWANLPPGTHIAWLAAFNDDTGADISNLEAAAPLWQAVDLSTGGSYPLEPGDFIFGLDVATGP